MRAIEEFMDAGCELSSPAPLFIGMFQATNGDPCKTGCAYFNGGKCEAYRKLFHAGSTLLPKPDVETVRNEAARLGISISEVRRRRSSQANKGAR